jgi:hypothetical protein
MSREKNSTEIDKQKNDITTVFNDFIVKKIAYANNQINQIISIFGKLASTTLLEIKDLSNNINSENNLIDSKITINKSLENDSPIVKFYYGEKELDILKYQNTILFSVFYVLVLIFGFIMFYFDNLSFIMQVVVFHLLLVYPFVIYYLELLLFIIYKYVYCYLFSIPYEKVYI